MALPNHWKATENQDKIIGLTQQANLGGLMPKHLLDNTEWYNTTRHGVELVPEDVPAWGPKACSDSGK